MEENLKTTIVEFLKSFARLLSQSSLYNENHPQVRQSAAQTIENINKLLSIQSDDRMLLSIVSNKLLLNGVAIASTEKIPNSITLLYKNCHIDSIEIMKGVSDMEIIKFTKISSSKLSPEKFLEENKIENIKIYKSKYIQVEQDDLKKAVEADKDIGSTIKEQDFLGSLKIIVSKITDDDNIQQKIIDELMNKFKKEVEMAVEKAVSNIKKEKIKIENDYTRVESVVSNISKGEIMIDKNGNVLMASPDSEKIIGKLLKEIVGKKILDITDLENQIVNISQNVSDISDATIKSNVLLRGKQDIADTIKSSTALIKNEEGKIVGTISVPPDIMKLKEIEQIKSDFISTVTHELRSPLTSIKMALDLVSRTGIKDQNVKSMLNSAIRNAERLNSVINDILDFSKLQSGKFVFNFSEIFPKEIVQNVIDSMSAWANSKNISLNFIDNNVNISIYADQKRTEQILINLVSNAIKFTPSGGKIDIITEIDSSNNYVVFSVKDTGCGIKKEDQEKIFERFVQVMSGEKVGGTGLGLAITKALVVMQKGKITVESQVGKGSTFKVFMPVYKQSIRKEILEDVKVEPKPWWKRIFGK